MLPFPYGLPIFSMFTFSCSLYLIVLKKEKFLLFHKKLRLFYILEFIYIVSIMKNLTIHYHFIKELLNIMAINLYIANFFNVLKNKNDMALFLTYFKRIIYAMSIIISLIGIYKFINISEPIEYFISEQGYPWGTALIDDYNYFSLSLIFGLSFGYDIMQKSRVILYKFLIFNSFPLIILAISMSGSRRGFIILILILVLFIIRELIKIITPPYGISKLFILNISFLLIITHFVSSQDIFKSVNIKEFNKIVLRLETLLDSSHSYNGPRTYDQRIERWEYANSLIHDFTLSEILTGSGFEYLEKYAKEFSRDYTKALIEDYPHNVFISHFLFSGSIGLLLLLIFYNLTFYYYWKYRSELKNFFLFTLIATFFSITSDDSIFTVKIYAIFLIFPILFQLINKRSLVDTEKSNINSIK